jgi:hypothetical protein
MKTAPENINDVLNLADPQEKSCPEKYGCAKHNRREQRGQFWKEVEASP